MKPVMTWDGDLRDVLSKAGLSESKLVLMVWAHRYREEKITCAILV